MKIYLQQDNASAGPFEESDVRERHRQGILAPDVYAWREGLADWLPLGEMLASLPPTLPPAAAAAMFPPGANAPVSMVSRTGMPWWGKLLLGCGGLAALAVIVVVGFVGFVIYKSEHQHKEPTLTMRAETGDAELDKKLADAEARTKKDLADMEEQIKRYDADFAHYEVVKNVSTDGTSSVTVTPRKGAPSPNPILTKRVDADGKITTTTLDDNGDTVTRSIDTHGNVITNVTPKGH